MAEQETGHDTSSITVDLNAPQLADHSTEQATHAKEDFHDLTEDVIHSAEELPAAGHGDDGGGHHGLTLGRALDHPPEPPHAIQFWYTIEQENIKTQYAADHGLEDAHSIYVLEEWLQKDEEGHWEQVEGESPTLAQTLHVGRLKEELPLIGYAPWENHVYFALAALVLIGIFYVATSSFRRNPKGAMRKPSRGQVFIESVVGGFDEFCKGILGEVNGRKYMPFIGTLFCLILTANLMGLVPFLKAPTSYIIVTFSLALCTFIVVQGTAWTKLGPGGYIYHLMGQPKDAFGWFLGAVLFLPLEIISDFIAKPLSLALRLFGNIFGKDILLGAFMGMGVGLVAVISPTAGHYFGIPLTIPFIILGLLLSTIQALVFALLSAIYISMVLPHEDHHDNHHEEDGHGVPATH